VLTRLAGLRVPVLPVLSASVQLAFMPMAALLLLCSSPSVAVLKLRARQSLLSI
jgi:hypothetical protein